MSLPERHSLNSTEQTQGPTQEVLPASLTTESVLTTESEGYRSGGEYGSDGDYNSDGGYGSGYNSDDTAGAGKTIFTNMVPVDKLKNGWTVMSNMFGKGLAFTKEKATDVYNSETVQSIKERTSEAAVRTSEAAISSYEYGKERAVPVIQVTQEKARGAWESTKEGLSAANKKAKPIVAEIRHRSATMMGMPIRPDDDTSEASEYDGLSPLSMSPPSSSPVSFSPPLSPQASRADSPVNGLDAPSAPGTRGVVAGSGAKKPVALSAPVVPAVVPSTEQSLLETEQVAGISTPPVTVVGDDATPSSPPVVDLLN